MFGTYQSFKAGGGQGTHCELPLVMWFGRQSGSPLKFESQRVRRSISNTNKQRYSSIYLCIYVYDYIHIYIYNYKRIKSFYICLNYLNLIYIYIYHTQGFLEKDFSPAKEAEYLVEYLPSAWLVGEMKSYGCLQEQSSIVYPWVI